MQTAWCGDTIPRELIVAARNRGHAIGKQPNSHPDGLIADLRKAKDRATVEKALRAGTPTLLCNASISSNGLDSLFSSAIENRSPIFVPYHRRVSPAYAALKAQVDSGEIGKIGFIKIHSNQYPPKTYSSGKAGSCSTVVFSELIHDIDWLNQCFGPIRTVFAQGVQKKQPTTEYVMASYTLKGGVTANGGVIAQVIHTYQSTVEPSLRVEICGTEGIVQYDSLQTPIRPAPSNNKSRPPLDGCENPWDLHWSAFEELVQKGKTSQREAQLLVAPVRIAQLTVESILSGTRKKV